MKFTLQFLALCVLVTLLAGCANDNYFPRTASLNDDLWTCKTATIKHDQETHRTFYAGAIDGVVSGILDQSKNNPDTEIEDCMAKKGYTGTSEN